MDVIALNDGRRPYEKIRRRATKERISHGPPSLWRYKDFLPVSDKPAVDLQAGYTPLIKADRLAAELGLKKLWVKKTSEIANPGNQHNQNIFRGGIHRMATDHLLFKVLLRISCRKPGRFSR